MKLSIIITAYNAAAYIIDTLNSICHQTYQDFEIVIVDDGSTDYTVNIIRDYMTKNPLMKINLFPTGRIGRAAALNYGVDHAQFEWIAIIDADDLWNKHKLEYQVKCIKEKKLHFIATRSKLFSNDNEVNINEVVISDPQAMQLTRITLDKMLYFNLISHSSVLIRKDLVKYDIKRTSQIDYEMFLRLLKQGATIYLLEECLTYHRIHSAQFFEERKKLRYSLSATGLQLKYCFLNFKLSQAFFVIGKLGYYILPKKLRFILRAALLNSD